MVAHDLSNETIGRSDPALLLTVPEELGAVDIPSRQIAPRALAKILVLHSHRSSGSRWGSGLLTAPGLNAGFLIRRDDEFRTMEGSAFPAPGIEIEDASGFASEIRIAGKDPTPVLPRTKGIST